MKLFGEVALVIVVGTPLMSLTLKYVVWIKGVIS